MKTHLLLLSLLTGCTHVYRNATGDNVAEVGFTTRIARSDLGHRTAIAVRSDPSSRWAKVSGREDISVRPGVQHFRFEGQWLMHPDSDHHHHFYSPCWGCSYTPSGNGGADAAFLIIGAVVAAAVIASEVDAHQPDVVSTCAVEVALDVARDEEIELTFRHDDDDRCEVVCSSYGDSGRKPCRLAEPLASN